MRKAIRTLLGGEPEIELVGAAENFAESLSMTRKFKPNVVILDLSTLQLRIHKLGIVRGSA